MVLGEKLEWMISLYFSRPESEIIDQRLYAEPKDALTRAFK
jgi:hypothetical protein